MQNNRFCNALIARALRKSFRLKNLYNFVGFLLPIKQVFALAFSALFDAAMWLAEGRFLLFPEQVCNVVHLVFLRYPIHTLVGAAAV